jgi:hypothetical protein
MNEDTFLTSALTIVQPKYRCRQGHEEIGTMAFWDSQSAPPVHCCLICWRDWMLAQGWEAVEVNAEKTDMERASIPWIE